MSCTSRCATRTTRQQARRRKSRSTWAAEPEWPSRRRRHSHRTAATGTGTDPMSRQREQTIQRYNRPARWFHAAVYIVVLALLGTGWWLRTGQEGRPSIVARLTGIADPTVHTIVGWVLTGLV